MLEKAESKLSRGWLPTRIRLLDEERELLLEKITALPQHKPRPLSDRLGYHSVPVEGADDAGASSQIDVLFDFYSKLDSIALVPAFVTGDSKLESYAFPKRFKIEVLESRGKWMGGDEAEGGRWVENRELAEWVEVANWLDKDFPDPGPYPVFFAATGKQIYQMRMTIPRQGTGSVGDFHALGEIYLFRQDKKGHAADNMMVWGDGVKIKASNSLSKPPLWDVQYLHDGTAGLGMPLSEEIFDVDDLMVAWDNKDSSEPVRIVLDLGETRQVGGVQLWPAQAPHGMAVPAFGFPREVTVELSVDPDFTDARRVVVNDARERMHHNNLLVIATRAYQTRFARITLDGFSEYQGRHILGMGEIRVLEYNDIWSVGCGVSADGLPEDAADQLPRLVDGYSRHRRILSEPERIKGLAMRRPLDRRLAVVELELEQARDAWNTFKLRASIWGGSLLGVGLLGAMGLQRLQRRKVLKRLRHRITRDLHDEVGSSLGGITLAARRMEKSGTTQDELSELSLMAREASASLKDVVWVTDQPKIHLPELLKKLGERAERVLRGVELDVILPDHCPKHVVPLPFKRHLLMFFKEAVHNCARHSNATAVRVGISVRDGILTLCLEDNGCGFDSDVQQEGWGIDSMGKRAAELGGKMNLHSEPGKGTTVALEVPLSALHKTDHSYKTSN